MPVPRRRLGRGPFEREWLEALAVDLAAILGEERSAYLRLGPEGAVLSVKSPEMYAFGSSIQGRWIRMTPAERARHVLGWIRKAATYCRRARIRYAPQRRDWFEKGVEG